MKQSTRTVELPSSSSARDFKKKLPAIPLNFVQKLLFVTKIAQTLLYNKKKNYSIYKAKRLKNN